MNSLLPINQLLDVAFSPRSKAQDRVGRGAILPRADILEGEKEYRIRIDLPGVEPDKLDINVENQVLTVKAERQLDLPEGFKFHRRELSGKSSLRRSFDLGRAVDADHIGAKLSEGVLTITLPKSEQNLPRRIDVE